LLEKIEKREFKWDEILEFKIPNVNIRREGL